VEVLFEYCAEYSLGGCLENRGFGCGLCCSEFYNFVASEMDIEEAQKIV